MSFEAPPTKRTRWAVAGYLHTAFVSFALLGDLIIRAFKKVVEGEGLDSYRTFWEMEFNYIGVLVLFGCIPVALVVGALWRLREYLQWRDLERRYRGGKRDKLTFGWTRRARQPRVSRHVRRTWDRSPCSKAWGLPRFPGLSLQASAPR
jgi:hypothetical protein